MHRQAVPDADEQVLTLGDGLRHRVTGEVGGRVPGHAEVAAGQHPPRQRLVQAPCGVPDDITFGHPSRMPAAGECAAQGGRRGE